MGLVDEDVEAVAAALRAIAGQAEPPFSVSAIAAIAFPEALVVEHDLPDGVDEVVTATPDGPLVWFRTGLPSDAVRFAVAHAIAHLHWDLFEVQAVIDAHRENRADLFAIELLVPSAWLRRHSWHADITALAHRAADLFGAPLLAIHERIRELKRLGEL